tara:strand:- start:5360 stop:5467 length:108 start_codon:yes stop_codon:yes gene_type:complete
MKNIIAMGAMTDTNWLEVMDAYSEEMEPTYFESAE